MPEDQARRLLNRGRTWLNCFCNDRSVSTQMGKATAILIHGPAIPFNLKTWWRCSKWNLPSDIHMCAYADLLSVVSSGCLFSYQVIDLIFISLPSIRLDGRFS